MWHILKEKETIKYCFNFKTCSIPRQFHAVNSQDARILLEAFQDNLLTDTKEIPVIGSSSFLSAR